MKINTDARATRNGQRATKRPHVELCALCVEPEGQLFLGFEANFFCGCR